MDADGSNCKDCVDKHCTPAFETCSGFTPPSSKALRHPRHNPKFLAAVLAIPDGTVLCAGQPKENYCDCQGDCTGLPEFCSCDEAKKCCAGATPTVTCPGQSAENYCDCQGDCTNNPEFCSCDAAKKCCAGQEESLAAPLLSCNGADKKIWDSSGKANFACDEKTCAMRCGGQNPCTGDCMSSKYGCSHNCGQCFGALSSCVVAHCLGSGNCAIAPNGEACKSCTAQHCTPAFESCTGFTPPAAAELETPLLSCTGADKKIWDSSGKANFARDEKTCAMRCGGQNPCTGDCMSSKYGYSHNCSHCLGSGNCAIAPHGEACKSCTNQHCTPAFESC